MMTNESLRAESLMALKKEYMKASCVSIPEVLKISSALMKGAHEVHIRQVQQALLKHYFNWLSYRAIAEYTGMKDHTVVPKNIKVVKASKYLNQLFIDFCDILDIKKAQ